MNSVFLLGNIAGEINLTETPSGTPKATFRLAVSNRPDANGKPRDPDYIWIKTWNGTATAVAKYLGKGSEILVQNGQIKTRSVKREDGTWDNYFEVNAPSIKFLRRPNGNGSSEEVTASTDTAPPVDDDEPVASGDIPF